MFVLTAISGLFFLQGLVGFPSGAPNRACQEMTPLHRGQVPQSSTPPYLISVNQSSYSVNGVVSVTISGCGTQTFQGFLLQARRADINSDRVTPVGYFDIPFGTRIVSGCGVFGQASTHQDANNKQSVTFQWTAPEQSEGDIVFVATFLQSYTTFWVKLYSMVIQDQTRVTRSNVGSEIFPSPSLCQAPPLPPATPTTPPETTKPTTNPTLPPQTEASTIRSQTGRPTLVPRFPSQFPPQTETPTTRLQTTQAPVQTSLRTPETETPFIASTTTDVLSSTASVTPRPECGESKSCYAWCPGGECTFNLTTRYTESEIVIELSTRMRATRSRWIAVGFSEDTRMGDDSVVECVLVADGRVEAYTSYNDGYDNLRIGRVGITSNFGSITDGVLTCTVNRLLTIESEPRIFDFKNKTEWYIFLASGEMNGNRKLQHSITPHVSQEKVNIRASQLTSEEEEDDHSHGLSIIRLHASLMLVAWVFSTSLGIIVARYYKLLGGSVTCCNDGYSFHVHRACMAVTFICVSISFIVIFVKVDGYSRFPSTEGLLVRAHPILGIIVTALVVLNFSMGLLRPAPGRNVRPIYNWAHWATGTVAWISAIITIFLGFAIERVKVHPAAKYVLLGFAVLHLLLQVSLELLSCHVDNTRMDKPDEPQYENIELTTMDSQNDRHNGNMEVQQHNVSGVGRLKSAILLLYTISLISILSALLVLVNYTSADLYE